MADIRFANPPGLPAPAARYSLAAEVRDARRAALAHHGMTPAHIVKLTTYLVGREARAAWQAERDALVGEHPPPASTQVIVAGLADPRWLLEVELIAAD